jgi:hypothetical protein
VGLVAVVVVVLVIVMVDMGDPGADVGLALITVPLRLIQQQSQCVVSTIIAMKEVHLVVQLDLVMVELLAVAAVG